MSISRILSKILYRLTIIFAVFGLVSAAFIFEVVHMQPNRDDLIDMYKTVNEICLKKSSTEQKTCASEIYLDYAPCLVPFSSRTETSACFYRAGTSVHAKFYPALSQPYMTSEALLNWITQFTKYVTPINLNFVRARSYFGPSVWNGYYRMLYEELITYERSSEAKVIEAMTNGDVDATFKFTGSPKIEDEGIVNGIYTWNVAYPALIELSDSKATPDEAKIPPIETVVSFEIVRSSDPNSKDGIAIASWGPKVVAVDLKNSQSHVLLFGKKEKELMK